MTSPLAVRRATLIALAVAVGAPAGGGSAAEARPYTVVSCDAAAGYAHSSEAWRPVGTAGSAYATCPSEGDSNRGISNRIVGATVPGFSYSSHLFGAPPGTTITGVRWGGRFARENCGWGAMLRAYPSRRILIGFDSSSQCSLTEMDLGAQSIRLAPPAGTTALQQIVGCGLATCGPGAAFHTRQMAVTIDDPTRPSLTASGPLVSGRWVRGSQQVTVQATDNSGISAAAVTLGPATRHEPRQCNYARTRP
jgi:hypothetical protein